LTEAEVTVQSFIEHSVNAAISAAGAVPAPVSELPERSSSLDIVIPVFNNRELFGRCLESLLPTLGSQDKVWLINDASDQPGIGQLMETFRDKWAATHIIQNPENLGFVGTSNRAFDLTDRDIVLLNSDTKVIAGWLEQMQACMERNPRAAIVCPLSDNATILSVLPRESNKDLDSIGKFVAETTIGDIHLPTAVGFCMLLRREFLDEAGSFSQVFSPGYGEENDLSMRALRLGWEIFAADRAFVFHDSGGSFGKEASSALQIKHQAQLDRIWPEYRALVQTWWRDNPLRAKTERLARRESTADGIVHVLHRQYHVGGTERVTRTLIREIGNRYQHTLLYPGETDGAWCDLELRSNELCRELMLNNRWIRPGTRVAGHGADLSCPHSERSLARIVNGTDAKIVHFHHMLHWDSLLLPALVKAMGCRVVISVHDLWFNCPIHNQLEYSSGQPCGRSYAKPDERCTNCLVAYSSKGLVADGESQNVTAYAKSRHALVQDMLQQADAVLVPSEFIREKLLAAYSLGDAGHIQLMPQGVAIPDKTVPPEKGDKRVLAYFGGDQNLKGAGLILKMASALEGSAVIFRIFGRIKGFDPATIPGNVELHGFYSPDNVTQAMEGVDLALLPSFYEESFSMVASECWAHGIPVLSSSRGAMKERVMSGINGWLVSDMQPESWIASLERALKGDTLVNCREKLASCQVTSIEQSAGELDVLYQALLENTAKEVSVRSIEKARGKFENKLKELRKTGLIENKPVEGKCLAVIRDNWGTANYRVRFPLEALNHHGVSESCDVHVIRESGFDVSGILSDSRARHIAIQPFLSDEGIKMMEALHRESLFNITLVIDDLWTDLPEDNPVRSKMPADVQGRLSYFASLADQVVLTTPELLRRLDVPHDKKFVINNALPEWIWESNLGSDQRTKEGRLRIGWAGAPQHAGDLEFLGKVIEQTRDLADWVFMGMCPDALQPMASEVHNMVPFNQYPAALSAANLDLAIAPLAAHPFNRCKSHLKVLEYGILGVPVVACDLEPYRHCPVIKASANNTDEWVEKIRGLLEDNEGRMDAGRNLKRWVMDKHMMTNRVQDWRLAMGITTNAD
jgi:GT2 family glycosyltransferase/glycosyltransferase involved in cell wall biosynthesis